jgi:DNA-binding NarL/FixJ family response regulator
MRQKEADPADGRDSKKLYPPPGSRELSAVHRPGSNIFPHQAWAQIARSLRISPKELIIARKVFDGCTEFAIAADLRMSCHTVRTHLKRLHRKLGVADRVGLVLCLVDEFMRVTCFAW